MTSDNFGILLNNLACVWNAFLLFVFTIFQLYSEIVISDFRLEWCMDLHLLALLRPNILQHVRLPTLDMLMKDTLPEVDCPYYIHLPLASSNCMPYACCRLLSLFIH